ncbi:MAG: M23 family metallopeptidase [Deltaproteobacteria bacterium]|nr:M23 family metallopeptidase [Deltaproteobacteria bacterium]
MKDKKRLLLIFWGLLLGVVFCPGSDLWAAAEGFVRYSHSGYDFFQAPEKPQPGQALVLALHPDKALPATLSRQPVAVDFIGRKFSLEALSDGWRGVVAVPLGTAAGSYSLHIRFKSGAELERQITVVAHDYGEQRLTVAAEMAAPMRAENLRKIERDRQHLKVAYASSEDHLLFADAVRPPLASTLTSPFGRRRLLNGKAKAPHGGVDFKAAVGVPVASAAQGRVVLAEELYYSGNLVIVDHGLDIFTLYMHLNEIDCRPGELVMPGQIIGTAGSSGRVTGPHLHWGVKIAGVFVDPIRFARDSRLLLNVPWQNK